MNHFIFNFNIYLRKKNIKRLLQKKSLDMTDLMRIFHALLSLDTSLPFIRYFTDKGVTLTARFLHFVLYFVMVRQSNVGDIGVDEPAVRCGDH